MIWWICPVLGGWGVRTKQTVTMPIQLKTEDGKMEIVLPKSLKIGAHEVKVLFPYVFTERNDLFAQYDQAVSEIRIAKDDDGGQARAESSLWVSLFHEMLHAIDYSTGHNMFNESGGEAKIIGLSEGLYQVLNDNGLLNKPGHPGTGQL